MVRYDNVSRETKEKLDIYISELIFWNKAINLISLKEIPNIKERHLNDSLQILNFIKTPVKFWMDIGSGGGFPGIVIAIVGQDLGILKKITLVESDKRKSAFLQQIKKKLSLNVCVENKRIENLSVKSCNILSARALAPLNKLLLYSHIHMKDSGEAIFPKGRKYKEEIEESQKKWDFNFFITPSEIEKDSVILRIKNIKPKS